MQIAELTWRHRNNFHFIASCRHCQKRSRHGDGYADARYQMDVFPARHCEHCGLNEYGERSEALADEAPQPPRSATE